MAWPIVSDYQDAVLNLQYAFNDPELKAGKPELDAQGFPRPRSGQFASVFRIQSAQRDWAVKCFTQEVKDLQERYAAIDQYLSAANLPYIVAFDYLAKGIRVAGQWYPILKMEWVKGELLGSYIEHHLNNPSDLRHIALQWVEMISALQAKSIAHGDLQERNVIVANGKLKLVDYDGMFVPDLTGRISHEIGHRNYQHPLRTAKDFGPDLDNFSAWVIYFSLAALSVDPTLWSRTKAGDEGLLFRKEDFEQPMLSQTLNLLETHPNLNVRTMATLFRPMLFLPPQHVPSLDGQFATTLQVLPPSQSSGASWWSDHAPVGQQKTATRTEAGEITAQSASWVLDFITPYPKAPKRVFSRSMTLPRLAAFLSGNSIVVAIGIGVLLPVSFPSIVPANISYFVWWSLVFFFFSCALICINGIILLWNYSRVYCTPKTGHKNHGFC